jgi:uncharacterized protein
LNIIFSNTINQYSKGSTLRTSVFTGLEIIALLGVILFIATLVLVLCIRGMNRRYAFISFRYLLLFYLIDWVWLSGLSWLKLSFGPIGIPWLVIVSARTGIFLLLLLSWFIAYIFKRDLIESGLKTSSRTFIAVQLVIFALGIYSFYIEPFWISTSHIPLETPKFTAGKKLRIVQLSDLHVERITRREIEAVRKVNDLHPDIILITGDYPNLSNTEDPVTWDQVSQIISQLHAPLGVFLIDGSVESMNKAEWLADRSGATALESQIHPVNWAGDQFFITGMADEIFHQAPVGDFKQLSSRIDIGSYNILLFHTPDLMNEAAVAGYDLYLCGHTHGGQIRLPFYGAIYTSSVFYKTYEMGLYRKDKTILYVNRGLGMEGREAPRARFLARPEIAVFDITGTGK